MCFNATLSITTYFLGELGCLLLACLGYLPESMFLSSVVQMQLVEFFLWKLPCSNQESISLNCAVTQVGIVINHIEPFVLWIGIHKYGGLPLPQWLDYATGSFLAITTWYTYAICMPANCTQVTPQSYPHLYWEWNEKTGCVVFYVLFLTITSLLCLFGLKHGNICCAITMLSYVISVVIYAGTHCVGSVWCFIAAFVPWLLSGTYYVMDKPNKNAKQLR